MNEGFERLNHIHLRRMVDDVGIFQHAMHGVPSLKLGYTSDDNARLALMAAAAYEATGEAYYLDLTYLGVRFLAYAEQDGWFRNFMSFDRRFIEERGAADCYGRCLWSLGTIAGRPALPQGLRAAADGLLQKTLHGTRDLKDLRAAAYTVLGLLSYPKDEGKKQVEPLLKFLMDRFRQNSETGWQWFEGILTYCNAVLPHALLAGYAAGYGEEYLWGAQESLDFLLQYTIIDGYFHPIGCNGWFPRGSRPAAFGQQSVEACCTLLACLTAHRLTGQEKYMEAARLCLKWYNGNNSGRTVMIDPETGGCYDGLEAGEPNLNQGSESLLSWYGSVLAMDLYERQCKLAEYI